jgi:hypothetical protein
MDEARARDAWNHTAALCAGMLNGARRRRDGRLWQGKDLYPMSETRRGGNERVGPAGQTLTRDAIRAIAGRMKHKKHKYGQ